MSEETNRIKIRELPDSDLTAQDLVALAKSDIEKTVHATIRDVIKAGLDLDAGNGIQIDTTDTGFKITNVGELDTSDLDRQVINLQAELDALKLAMNNLAMGVVASPEPPENVGQGTLWWDTNTASMYIKYNGVWIQSNLSTAGAGDMPIANTDVLGGVMPDDSFQVRHDGTLKLSHNVTLTSANHDHDGDGLDDAVRWTPNTTYYKNQMIKGPDNLDQNDPHMETPVGNIVYNTTKAHTSTTNFLNDRNRGLLSISSTVLPAEGSQLNLENTTGGHYSMDTYHDVTNWFGRGADRTYMRLHDNTGSGQQILFDLKDGGGAWMVDSDNLKHGDSSSLIPWCCGGGGDVDYKYIDRKQVYYEDSAGQKQGTGVDHGWVNVDVSDLVPSNTTGLIIHAKGSVASTGEGVGQQYSGTTWIDVKSDEFASRDVVWVRPDGKSNSASDTNTLVIPYTSNFQVRARFVKGNNSSSRDSSSRNWAWVYLDGYITSGEPTGSAPGQMGRIHAIGNTYRDNGDLVISNSVPTGDWLVHFNTQENDNNGADEELIMTHSRRYSVPPGQYMWFKATPIGLWNIFTGTDNQPAAGAGGWNQLASWGSQTNGVELEPGETIVLHADNRTIASISGTAIELIQDGSGGIPEDVEKRIIALESKSHDITGGQIIRAISSRIADLQHNQTGWQIPNWQTGDQLFFVFDLGTWTEVIPATTYVQITKRLNVALSTSGLLRSYGSGNVDGPGAITFFHIRGNVGYSVRNSRGQFV